MHTTIYKINNKDLLYSTGNYIQYLVINYNEKEQEKNQSISVEYHHWLDMGDNKIDIINDNLRIKSLGPGKSWDEKLFVIQVRVIFL